MIRMHVLAVSMALLLAGCESSDRPAPAAVDHAPAETPDGQSQPAFEQAVDALTRSYFGLLPEAATYYGADEGLAPGYSSRLNDRSPAGVKALTSAIERQLDLLKSVPGESLEPAQRRARDSLVVLFDGALGPSRLVDYGSSLDAYGVWFLPYVVNQISGPVLSISNLMAAQQGVSSDKQAQAYLDRLRQVATALDGVLDKLRHDVALGAIPPDFVLHKSRAVIEGFAGGPAESNVLYTSFVGKLDTASVADSAALAAQALQIIEDEVLPAYRRIGAYLREIEPNAPHEAGVWRLPNGEALYAAMVRQMTDSDLDPETVHQIGLDEVARITAEMNTLLEAQGYTEGTVAERMLALGREKRFIFPNTESGKAALRASIEEHMARVDALLPQYFGVLPKHPVELRVVPEYAQASAPRGYYDAPAPDGTRPGIYWVNLRDTAMLPGFSAPTLTFHEANPGHHMQVAIAVDQPAPFLAKVFFSNSTGEGWALYAEALAAEMGLYVDDPFGDLGRLRDELHRAVRLVVDTGLHAKRWTREQAITYMIETEGALPATAESEVERYAVWPAQALGYKIGMLTLQQLRREAEAAFGERFDIRDFHDRVLAISSSALPVIEREIRAWIDEQAGDRGAGQEP